MVAGEAGPLPCWAVLATAARPLAIIPAGAAIGDVPHFGAIAVRGLTWAMLVRAARR